MDLETPHPADGHPLFSVAQVGLATFLGTPIAGAWLMRKNFLVLGQASAATRTLLIGFFATGLLFFVAFWLPESFPSQVLPLVSILSMNVWYNLSQGEAFKTHAEAHGATASWGIAAGIGFLCLVAICSLLFGAAMMVPVHWFE